MFVLSVLVVLITCTVSKVECQYEARFITDMRGPVIYYVIAAVPAYQQHPNAVHNLLNSNIYAGSFGHQDYNNYLNNIHKYVGNNYRPFNYQQQQPYGHYNQEHQNQHLWGSNPYHHDQHYDTDEHNSSNNNAEN